MPELLLYLPHIIAERWSISGVCGTRNAEHVCRGMGQDASGEAAPANPSEIDAAKNERDAATIHTAGRGREGLSGSSLPRDWSAEVFLRSRRVRWIEVELS